MEWWVFEIIVGVLLVGIIALLGPFIKRFGKAYAADVFRANPRTGKSYLVLMDIAYYLVFGAYALLVVQFDRDVSDGWAQQVNGRQVESGAIRIGGLLLLMGLLHGLNVLSLPVIGRLFSLNRQLDDPEGEAGRLEVA